MHGIIIVQCIICIYIYIYIWNKLWNKLPITVTNENNTNNFKSKLHKYLLGLD